MPPRRGRSSCHRAPTPRRKPHGHANRGRIRHRLQRMHRQPPCLRPVRTCAPRRPVSAGAGRCLRTGDAGRMPPHPAVRQLGRLAPRPPVAVAPAALRMQGGGGLGLPGLGTDRAGAHGRWRRRPQRAGQQFPAARSAIGLGRRPRAPGIDGAVPDRKRTALRRLRRAPAAAADGTAAGAVRAAPAPAFHAPEGGGPMRHRPWRAGVTRMPDHAFCIAGPCRFRRRSGIMRG